MASVQDKNIKRLKLYGEMEKTRRAIAKARNAKREKTFKYVERIRNPVPRKKRKIHTAEKDERINQIYHHATLHPSWDIATKVNNIRTDAGQSIVKQHRDDAKTAKKHLVKTLAEFEEIGNKDPMLLRKTDLAGYDTRHGHNQAQRRMRAKGEAANARIVKRIERKHAKEDAAWLQAKKKEMRKGHR
jgi:hypothetical protein